LHYDNNVEICKAASAYITQKVDTKLKTVKQGADNSKLIE